MGGSAFRAEQQAVFLRNLGLGVCDSLVADRQGRAAAFAHRAQDQEVADRHRHANPGGEGVGVLPQRRVLLTCLEGLDDGRAALRLDGEHLGALGADPPHGFQLREGFPHADQAGSATGRIEDCLRQFPAELLGQLQSHGFLALDPVGLLQGRGVEPADRLLALADDLAAVVDEPVDLVDSRALQTDLAHVHVRRVLRAEDRGARARAPGIGGKRRPCVAIGRHDEVLDAQLLTHGNRER